VHPPTPARQASHLTPPPPVPAPTSPPRTQPVDLNCIHAGAARPHLFAVGGGDEWARVYDVRGAARAPAGATAAGALFEMADAPAARLAPARLRPQGPRRRVYCKHITGIQFSGAGELLATYNDDDIFLFSPEGYLAGPAGAGGAAAGAARLWREAAARAADDAAGEPAAQRRRRRSGERAAGAGGGGWSRPAGRLLACSLPPHPCLASLRANPARTSSGDERPGAVRRRQEAGDPSGGGGGGQAAARANGGGLAGDLDAGDLASLEGSEAESTSSSGGSLEEAGSGSGSESDGEGSSSTSGDGSSDGSSDSGSESDEDGGSSDGDSGLPLISDGEDGGGGGAREPAVRARAPGGGGAQRAAAVEAEEYPAGRAPPGAEDFVIGTFSGHRNARTVKVGVGAAPPRLRRACGRGRHRPRFALPQGLDTSRANPTPLAPRAASPPPPPALLATQGVSFFGSDDEYVVSGSDDGHVYIWSKVGPLALGRVCMSTWGTLGMPGATGRGAAPAAARRPPTAPPPPPCPPPAQATGSLLWWARGDDDVVNCLEPHPFLPGTLATSGAPRAARRGAASRAQTARALPIDGQPTRKRR
jgi:hypothetical protein